MKRMHRWLVVASIAGVAGACGGSGSDSTTGPNNNGGGGSEVQAGADAQFSPNTITVAVGGTVTWVFGGLTHNVTFAQVAGVPGDIGSSVNTSISRTFNTAGTFTYQCTLHPGMTGTVKVQ